MRNDHPALFNYRYSLTKKLGEGAQGAVHLAIDTVTNRQVALKVLHVGQSDNWLALFRHEFEILADLSHPYLAQVHDFGVTPGGEVFFTRDYLPGIDLLSATSDVTVPHFVAICVQMCRALRPLHRNGLIHGDIKPGNLLFGNSRQDADGKYHCTAFPIDFSFVRAASGQAPARGTLQYIAPEILEQAPIDVRADLYALGVSIYQAASGVLPFEPDVYKILSAHREGRVPPWRSDRIRAASTADEYTLQGLGEIVHRLIATSPDNRFPDLDELEAALTSLAPAVIVADKESFIPGRSLIHGQSGLPRDQISVRIFSLLQQSYQLKNSTTLHVVEGEVGSGRSAIRKAVKWQAQLNGIHVLEAACYGDADPFAPLREIILQAATVLGGTAHEQQCLHIAKQLMDFSKAKIEFHHLATQIVQQLEYAAEKSALLITVDNIQRACGEMLTILRALLSPGQKRLPIAIVATSVSEFNWRDTLGHGEVHMVLPLTEAEIARLVTAYLKVEGSLLSQKILEHTGGNPLFVTQLLHNCIVTEKSPQAVISETVVTDVQSYWQVKLGELNKTERQLLAAVAVLGRPCEPEAILSVADLDGDQLSLFSKLIQQRWLKQVQTALAIRSNSLSQQILNNLEPAEFVIYSARAFGVETVIEQKLVHAVNCGETEFVDKNVMSVVATLEHQGALSTACRLLTAVVNCQWPLSVVEDAELSLGRIQIALGELVPAKARLRGLGNSQSNSVRQSALRYLGKIAVQESALEDAATLLNEALRIDENAITTATVFSELCEIEFRRGRYKEAVETANQGLDLLGPDDPHRCNLLCSKAKANAAQGRTEVAMVLADEAVALARHHQQKRLLAFATDVRAWVLGLQGNLEQATMELEQCAILYREMGDTARLARSLQVIGNNYWWLEKWFLMLKKHEEALHVAASLDNPAGRNEQLIAYGYALNCIGRFEEAALVFSRAEAEASRISDSFQLAKIAVYQGDWCAWQGNFDAALAKWKKGYDGFAQLSAYALLAELALEMAGALISKGSVAELADAKRWMDKASSHPREDLGRHYEYLFALTNARYQIAIGSFEAGFAQLNALLTELEKRPIYQLQWQAHYYAAGALLHRGMKVLARRQLRQAEAALEALSVGLPPEHHVSFWQDARRAEIRRILEQLSSEQLCDSSQVDLPVSSEGEASKLYRVLEFNKRISRETDMEVLTSEILDAAIELTGAEQGFFLAKGEEGLEIRAARHLSAQSADVPHRQFSSSIAESVFLDNEPVLTVDALRDPRFNEFLSIHHLQIKSVACLPISFRSDVLGVLYLENRLARGKFDHRDMRVLSAFSDQMAIALAHATALDEKKRIQLTLQDTARQLNDLVLQQSEDLKSKEAGLELAKEQLQRIRERVASSGNFFGMIGTGAAMQQVFNRIERVKDNDIPVVIVGASGTGKDLTAKIIHEAGKRNAGPFVHFSCGAIPETLVESTLFGHRQGAFSGAQTDSVGIFSQASGGTLYLDDVAEISMRMQVDLLRVLQEGAFSPLGDHRKIRVDFRLVCSSRVPLQKLVDAGKLRADLFYRLDGVNISLPTLTERQEDIPVLAVHIAKREAARLEIPWSGFSSVQIQQISAAKWPGNIRELEQYIRRLLVMGQSEDAAALVSAQPEPAIARPIANADREQIVAALEQTQWNKTRAAELLGLPRRTFYRRLKEFHLL